ncbi:MAG: ribosome biogenesis GTPase Der [Actinomycetia bacterium]|nr:ribosome biogenesis GTPase Der [Actinomycetes bacterium]MCP4228496.1 ribosome biogenesis GTPase Der [Actinomycetes bacterium]
MSRPARVAIVGRPNVGKSTLLNRIIGRREAIVEEKPGVTRDRKEVEADWQGREFTLIDTGGWLVKGNELENKVSRQAESALADADVVLFVVDATVGITDQDEQMARRLRGIEPPVLVVANKIDDDRMLGGVWDLVALGLGDPHPVSSIHGRGMGDLLDELVAVLPDELDGGEGEDVDGGGAGGGSANGGDEERVFSIAVVGRPNVGKSTLFNRLIGEERSVVHDMPGTTRDTIDTVVDTERGPIRFLDTAGMRRRSRISENTEYYSVVRALKSVDTADVALLVVDATEGVTGQDQRLAERVDAAGCPIVVVLNKIEMLTTDQREDLSLQMERKLSFLPGVSVHRISALSGKGVQQLLPSLGTAIDAYQTRIPTRAVNDVIRRAQQAQPAPGGARVLYATQGATDPPTFTLFTNRSLHDSYVRYLERKLREAFDFGPTPLKLRVRRRSE